MKALVLSILLAGYMTSWVGKQVERYQASQMQWHLELAVQHASKAKADYREIYLDGERALTEYDEASPAERLNMLTGDALLSEEDALYLADPGSMAETATPHSKAEMVEVAKQARRGAGEALASLNSRITQQDGYLARN